MSTETSPPLYRMKRAETAAVQFTGSNQDAVAEFTNGAYGPGLDSVYVLYVRHAARCCRLEPGDWAVREIDGGGWRRYTAAEFAEGFSPALPATTAVALSDADCARLQEAIQAPNLDALREHYGRIVRDTWIAWAAKQPDVADHPSWLMPWEDLAERDREVDTAIAEAVVREWGQDNAILWGVPCPGCARMLDRAYEQTCRAEKAEAENAALREALKRHMLPLGDSHGIQLCAGCLEPKPCPDEGLAEGGTSHA